MSRSEATAKPAADQAASTEAASGFSRQDFMVLTKARLSALVVVTTFAGYWLHHLLADWPADTGWQLVHTLFGTTLTAFGAAVFNQLMEMDADARMKRTAGRPLPARRLPPEAAFGIGAVLSALGIIHLGVKVNTESAALAGLTLLVYLFIYTPMKRRSPLNTLVGAVSGAIPPVIGWVAVPGGKEINRELVRTDLFFNHPALFLFSLLFLWQLPHFLAINWMYRDEYIRGGFKMWCNTDETGRLTARRTLAWCLLMLPLAVWPPLAGFTSWIFAVPALLLGGWLVALSVQFLRVPDRGRARKLFFATLLYLPVMLAALLLCAGR
ncbi:MAG TPA: heme o synthase [Verrucomicrobiales bacterium]|nr:heme o synthase [Verrucomicrobiales bacterium]